ncbi:HEPN domain-containing protein [Winogradskyella wichelsiae]|uniref:HEPN domain-containing protein n=1 Tax=Winogradskyella wichelsiae TaxID=2697007 RepID=UPI003EF4D99D
MYAKIQTKQKHIIDKLKSLLEIRYVYKSKVEGGKYLKSLLIIILQGNCSSLTKELSAMVAKIFQEETEFLYRIFSFEYAHHQLKEENLFFVHGCSWEKQIFYNPNSELDNFHEYYATEKTLNQIQSIFEKEHYKMAAFMDGAKFFVEKSNLHQAAFMLHQYIELWFRYTALILMGKERKSHSLKELQTYLKTFSAELGNLFITEIEEEKHLLKLLDDAYIATRYENNYHINNEQIHRIIEKATKIELIATLLFKNKLDNCIKHELNPNDVSIPKKESSQPNDTELSKFINSLSINDFSTLKPYPHKKGLYTIDVLTEGYLDTSFMISNLLKVCITAMDTDHCSTRSIPNPEHNIKEVLGYVLDMIPHNEMEVLDGIKDIVLNPKRNSL